MQSVTSHIFEPKKHVSEECADAIIPVEIAIYMNTRKGMMKTPQQRTRKDVYYLV
jgi:hypothetical protein